MIESNCLSHEVDMPIHLFSWYFITFKLSTAYNNVQFKKMNINCTNEFKYLFKVRLTALLPTAKSSCLDHICESKLDEQQKDLRFL